MPVATASRSRAAFSALFSEPREKFLQPSPNVLSGRYWLSMDFKKGGWTGPANFSMHGLQFAHALVQPKKNRGAHRKHIREERQIAAQPPKRGLQRHPGQAPLQAKQGENSSKSFTRPLKRVFEQPTLWYKKRDKGEWTVEERGLFQDSKPTGQDPETNGAIVGNFA
jgi:hypothetical protein